MENKPSSDHLHPSQWLHTTISDLDEKMKTITSILKEDHCSDEGADVDKRWRKDTEQVLEELSKSYRTFAIAYEQLRSDSSHTSHSGSSSSSISTITLCAICNGKATGNFHGQKLEDDFNCGLKSIVRCSDLKFDGTDQINKLEDEDEIMTDFSANEDFLTEIDCFGSSQKLENPSTTQCDFGMWSGLDSQITQLVEDNLQQLVELARRNDEKRETIKKLLSEIEALKRENRALQISSRYSNADSEHDQSQITRHGRISVSKLFRGCST